MDYNKRILFVILLAFFLSLSGCYQIVKGTMQDAAKREALEIQEVSGYNDLVKCDDPEQGEGCKCFICTGASKDEVTNLKGGACSIENCKKQKFEQLTDPKDGIYDDSSIRNLMLGQGTQFIDFDLGNKYCSSDLDMAIKWIHVREDDSKIVTPLQSRAACFLENNVIPVYVLSANNTVISPEKAGIIAKSLSGAGPVVITTQINFDATEKMDKKAVIEQIRAQVNEIDKNCPDCLIAVTPKMGDQEGLDELLLDLNTLTKVDFIAFGVDSRFSKTSKCNAAKLLDEATDFTQYALSSYGKPSIWVYMMVESNGKNLDETCTWDTYEQPKLFNSVFSTDLPILVKNGVVGISPYAYYDADNPLGCTHCTLSSPTIADNVKNFDFKPNEPYFSHWYWFCKEYVTPGIDIATTTGKMLSVFPPKVDNSLGCQFLEENNAWYFKYASLDNKYGLKQFTNPASPQAFSTQPEDFKSLCEMCAVRNKKVVPEGLDFEGSSTTPTTAGAGTIYPVIDFYADKFDVDSLLLRATIDSESGFNPCAASEVKDGESKCYSSALSFVPDPEESPNNCNIQSLPSGKSYCAFGLGQIRVAPSTMWEELKAKGLDGQYYDSSNALKTLCSENFNPYDPANASCASAYYLRLGWDQAETQVTSKYVELGLDSPNSELADWYKSYIALYLYGSKKAGSVDSLITKYSAVKDKDESCQIATPTQIFDDENNNVEPVFEPYKAVDFIDYVHKCESEEIAFTKLRKYNYLLQTQPNSCEP